MGISVGSKLKRKCSLGSASHFKFLNYGPMTILQMNHLMTPPTATLLLRGGQSVQNHIFIRILHFCLGGMCFLPSGSLLLRLCTAEANLRVACNGCLLTPALRGAETQYRALPKQGIQSITSLSKSSKQFTQNTG